MEGLTPQVQAKFDQDRMSYYDLAKQLARSADERYHASGDDPEAAFVFVMQVALGYGSVEQDSPREKWNKLAALLAGMTNLVLNLEHDLILTSSDLISNTETEGESEAKSAPQESE